MAIIDKTKVNSLIMALVVLVYTTTISYQMTTAPLLPQQRALVDKPYSNNVVQFSKAYIGNEAGYNFNNVNIPPNNNTMGNPPTAIAVNPNTNKIYVIDSGVTYVIDGTTDKVVDNLTLDYNYNSLSDISVNPKTNRVYAMNSIGYSKNIMDIDSPIIPLYDEVYVINGSTNKVLHNITITHNYSNIDTTSNNISNNITSLNNARIAVNEETNKIYVANYASNTISVIDGKIDKVLNSISVNGHPSAIAINSITNMIYVIKEAKDGISVIDGKRDKVVREDLFAGKSPADMVINPETNKIYVALSHANRISVIDGNTNSLIASILSGNFSNTIPDITVNPKSNILYKTNPDSTTISVINSSNNIPLGDIDIPPIKNRPSPALSVLINPSTNKIYVLTDQSQNFVSVINGVNIKNLLKKPVLDQSNQAELQIPGIVVDNKTQSIPSAIVINPTTNKIYVANYASNTISVIDGTTDKVENKIKVGKSPAALDFDDITNKIYVANYASNTISVIDGTTDKVVDNITLNSHPYAIIANPDPIRPKIYVINSQNTSSIISVINPATNKVDSDIRLNDTLDSIMIDSALNMLYAGDLFTNIVYEIDGTTDKVVDNITTAENNFQTIQIPFAQNTTIPSAIAVNPITNMVYVVGPALDEAFIIDPYINRIISTIPVGSNPVAIALNEETNKIYVANYASNTISVIDGKINAVVSNITVGQPTSIAINPNTNMVYVIDDSDSLVHVINGKTDKIQAGVTFNIHPANSGHIKCNDKEFATNEFNRIEFDVQCAAEPNKGFQFTSWTENLGHNSSKALSTSVISSDSPFNSLLNALELTPKDNAAILNINQYGNFTANFKELPPPIPPEYWIPLYGVIVSSIVGWSIPSIIGWVKSKRHGGRVHQYHKRIASLYNDGKLDQNDIKPLDKLKNDITDAYAKGKISDQHYTNLTNEISILYEEIYNKKIDSLNSKLDNASDGITLDKLKNDITDTYAKGKISDQHYSLLNEKIMGVNKLASSLEKIATESRTEGSPIKTNK